MRAIIFDKTQACYVEDLPLPQPSESESLIRVEIAAICNTDREILRGYRPDFCGVMGHEFVGVVAKSANSELIGKRVVGEINISCGNCLYCNSGRANHCLNRASLGMHAKDGCFADYLSLPTKLLHVVDDGLVPQQAVFCEPLAAALRISEQVQFFPNMPVAIVGDGRLALMICQALAATTKTKLTVIGRHRQKLALFAPYARVVCAFDYDGHEDFDLELAQSFEVVVDASGSPNSLHDSITITRSGGTLVVKSTYAGEASLNMSEVVVRELRIVGSRCGPFAPALALLKSGDVSLPPVSLFAPENFRAAFDSRDFKAALDFCN